MIFDYYPTNAEKFSIPSNSMKANIEQEKVIGCYTADSFESLTEQTYWTSLDYKGNGNHPVTIKNT